VIIIVSALKEYKEYNNLHTEYQEPLIVIVSDSNIEQFHLHILAVYCKLSTLPALHDHTSAASTQIVSAPQ
jgi:hypothetical protein